jgi:uncharacterized membrane protein YtjA (UPF0391 family)
MRNLIISRKVTVYYGHQAFQSVLRGLERAVEGFGGVDTMLSWAIVFLVIALIAAFLGFTGVAGTAAGIAQILFVVFLILFVVSLIFGRRTTL